MKLSTTLAAAAAFALSLAAASAARADQTPVSTISQIKVLTSADARYRLFHGAIWLQVDKATQNYRWGGKQCGGTIDAAGLKLLYDAFRAKHSVTLDYDVKRYRKQTARCITAFTITR